MGLKSATVSDCFIKFFTQMEVRRCTLLGLHPFEPQSELFNGSGFWVHLRPSNALIAHWWAGACLLFFVPLNEPGMSHFIAPFGFHFCFAFMKSVIPLCISPKLSVYDICIDWENFAFLADSSCLCHFCTICFRYSK